MLWSDTTAAFRLRVRADAITLLLPSLSEEECGILDSKTAGVLKALPEKILVSIFRPSWIETSG